ncbi:MAG TPA: hypothetical protein VJ184_11515 [Chryseolinea sp.]|nr:hypothetical protein [Chryseolinea sp.]
MSRINNLEELILEKKRLESDLITYKSTINSEIQHLKQKMEPISNVVSFFSTAKTVSPNNKLLQVGTNIGIDILLREKLLSKAGWFTRLVLPYVLKKVSSKAIEKVHEIRT